MGLPELLRVIEAEAAREAADVRAAGEREAERVVREARVEAGALVAARAARARAEAAAAARSAAEARARERDRALLLTRRRALDALQDRVRAALVGAAGPELDARLLAEVLPEAGPGPLAIVVDPGAEEACREALRRLAPSASVRADVRGAPVARGGLELRAGSVVLDDTLPSRLDRLWPDVEAELCRMLLEEGAPCPGSTA